MPTVPPPVQHASTVLHAVQQGSPQPQPSPGPGQDHAVVKQTETIEACLNPQPQVASSYFSLHQVPRHCRNRSPFRAQRQHNSNSRMLQHSSHTTLKARIMVCSATLEYSSELTSVRVCSTAPISSTTATVSSSAAQLHRSSRHSGQHGAKLCAVICGAHEPASHTEWSRLPNAGQLCGIAIPALEELSTHKCKLAHVIYPSTTWIDLFSLSAKPKRRRCTSATA